MATQSSNMPPVSRTNEIKIVSHSSLFYWWPVWAIGFLMGLISWWSGHLAVVVPAETKFATGAVGTANVAEGSESKPTTLDNHRIYIIPNDKDKDKTFGAPRLHIGTSKNLGVIFCATLILVIIITNIPLRGLWSVIVIIVVIALIFIFALLEWWDRILTAFGLLDIRINMGGYFFISSCLLIAWLVVVIFFDQQIYMVFTPGQFRVRLEIGEGETAYDTTGMTIQKQRSDLFRHWILGLGSGDLVVRTSGAQAHQFDLHNVLFLGRKVKMIEEMLRSRPVVSGN